VTTPAQLSLSFEPGLTAQFRSIEDCCAAVVHSHRGGVESVAPALNMAPSELSRRLNAHMAAKEGDVSNRPFRACDFIGVLDSTHDFRPIYWLIEKYLRDPEAQRTQAITQLAYVMPVIEALLEQAGAGKVRAVK